MSTGENLLHTPLYAWHAARGAKMVPFAGYSMPVQYAPGILQEHLHTRLHSGLFDVSHMGQALLRGRSRRDVGEIFECLVPSTIASLVPTQQRYTLLLNEAGGIRDDLIVTRHAHEKNTLYLVVNAACKKEDFNYIENLLHHEAELQVINDHSLVALQGPASEKILASICPEVKNLKFMQSLQTSIMGFSCLISRSGYTGEDGFEISFPDEGIVSLADSLCANNEVQPIGLGARDSLRLEAGLCLYGHDIDTTTSPVEANLIWTISKNRQIKKDFPGASRILQELETRPSRVRVGISPLTRVPAREGTEIFDAQKTAIGKITSGGYGPNVKRPIAMGYVKVEFSKPGTHLYLKVRDQMLPAEVAKLPFVEHHYKR